MILSFLAVIRIGGVVSILLGTRLEHRTIVCLAQAKVRHDLSSAWTVYNERAHDRSRHRPSQHEPGGVLREP